MYFNNVGNVSYIDGRQGIYDNKIQNKSVRYARNAVSNYLNTYSIDSFNPQTKFEDLPQAKFEMKYAETQPGLADKMAVLGMAYEELGKKISIKVQELTNMLKQTVSPQYAHLVDASSLDLNKDEKIDLSEYAASLLAEDMLSTDDTSLDSKNIDGRITSDGQNALLAFVNKNNYDAAVSTFKAIHNAYDLNSAQEEFISDENNLV